MTTTPLPKAGWFLPIDRINNIMAESVVRQIKRTKQAHHTDLDIRINGQNEHEEADWIKHLEPVDSDPRTPKLRLVDEVHQNADRVTKLGAFIKGNPIFQKLTDQERLLMARQHALMLELDQILNERLVLFNENAANNPPPVVVAQEPDQNPEGQAPSQNN